MVLRSGVRRIPILLRLQRHAASNGLLPWINHYRLAGSAVFPSVDRTMSTNARNLDMATVQDPLETFRQHFKKGTLTRPLVVLCLEDAVRLNQPGSRMGEAATMWLWRSYDSIEYPLDMDLVNHIALLLVREGKEELLWDWMDQETRKPASEATPDGLNFDTRYDWRTAAFRGLVEAKTHLATDQSLDAALECFFRGTKVSFYLSTHAAANFCHHKLTNIPASLSPARYYEDIRKALAFTKTNPGLWGAFYTELGKRSDSFATQDRALMMLHHPQHPDPWPLLKFWRQAERSENHPFRHVKSRTATIALVERSRDMRLVLDHLGYHEEATWVKKFTRELFPRGREPSGKSRREGSSVDGKPLPSL